MCLSTTVAVAISTEAWTRRLLTSGTHKNGSAKIDVRSPTFSEQFFFHHQYIKAAGAHPFYSKKAHLTLNICGAVRMPITTRVCTTSSPSVVPLPRKVPHEHADHSEQRHRPVVGVLK